MAAVPADAPMPVVIPLVGLPGAGKTTLADALARAFGLRMVSRDLIRDALFPACRYTPTEQRAAFRAVLARAPDRQEKAILQASLAKQQARFRADPASAAAFLAVGEKPPAPGIAPAEHAAYSAVCLALLNLDETLTKS